MMKFKRCIEKELYYKNLSAFKHALQKMSQTYERWPQGILYNYLLAMRTIDLLLSKKSQYK